PRIRHQPRLPDPGTRVDAGPAVRTALPVKLARAQVADTLLAEPPMPRTAATPLAAEPALAEPAEATTRGTRPDTPPAIQPRALDPRSAMLVPEFASDVRVTAPRATRAALVETEVASLGAIPAPDPAHRLPPRFTELFVLYVSDGTAPRAGMPFALDLPGAAALAVRDARVLGAETLLQVTGWCMAAGDRSGLKRIHADRESYGLAELSDRVRLVLVRLHVETDSRDLVGASFPDAGLPEGPNLAAGQPILVGWDEPQLMDRAKTWLGAMDAPTGAYFFDAETLSTALAHHGCDKGAWAGGAPQTALGRQVQEKLRPAAALTPTSAVPRRDRTLMRAPGQ
ncbi:MAG: hypothetical protein AAF908_08625, partial [Pseudomonadota bacterium]